MVLGEGVVEDRGAGLGVGGEAVTGAQPLFVQGVEPVESAAQDAEPVDPVRLDRSGRQGGQLRVGRGQQVAGAGAYGLERGGGVGVALALALAQSVGVVVVRPAVEVGVFVGVFVPRGKDLLAVLDEDVEVVQEVAVSEMVEGDRKGSSQDQRRAVGRATGLVAGAWAVVGVCCCRRAARAWARIASSRRVCAATICCGVSGLGS